MDHKLCIIYYINSIFEVKESKIMKWKDGHSHYAWLFQVQCKLCAQQRLIPKVEVPRSISTPALLMKLLVVRWLFEIHFRTTNGVKKN